MLSPPVEEDSKIVMPQLAFMDLKHSMIKQCQYEFPRLHSHIVSEKENK